MISNSRFNDDAMSKLDAMVVLTLIMAIGNGTAKSAVNSSDSDSVFDTETFLAKDVFIRRGLAADNCWLMLVGIAKEGSVVLFRAILGKSVALSTPFVVQEPVPSVAPFGSRH